MCYQLWSGLLKTGISPLQKSNNRSSCVCIMGDSVNCNSPRSPVLSSITYHHERLKHIYLIFFRTTLILDQHCWIVINVKKNVGRYFLQLCCTIVVYAKTILIHSWTITAIQELRWFIYLNCLCFWAISHLSCFCWFKHYWNCFVFVTFTLNVGCSAVYTGDGCLCSNPYRVCDVQREVFSVVCQLQGRNSSLKQFLPVP